MLDSSTEKVFKLKAVGVISIRQLKKLNLSSDRAQLALFCFFFVTFAAIAMLFQPAADDLAWPMSAGRELLAEHFRNYNGRYLGNLSAIALTTYPKAAAVIKSAVLCAAVYLMQYIMGSKSYTPMIFCLIALPFSVFRQAIVWTAGFSNYMLSSLLLLCIAGIYLYAIRNNKSNSLLLAAAMLLLSTACQLFVETATVFALLLAAAIVICEITRCKKPSLISVTALIGSLAGATIMFSNSVYSVVSEEKDMYNEEVYQKIITSFDSDVKTTTLEMWNNLLGVGFKSLAPPLVIIMALCIIISMKRSNNRRITELVVFASIAAATALIALGNLISIILLLLLITAAVIAFCVKFMPSASSKRIIVLYLIIGIFTAPFLVVYPVGPRCFTAQYLAAVMIIIELLSSLGSERLNRTLGGIFAVALVAVTVFNSVIYAETMISNKAKVSYIASEIAQGNKDIKLHRTEFADFTYGIDSEHRHDKLIKRFFEYYSIPYSPDVTIEYYKQ